MSHYAEIGPDNKVIRVLVADRDFIDAMPGVWVQTSYNTRKGKHLKGKRPLRKNFAGIGYTYDRELDAFIPPKPTVNPENYKFDKETCTYKEKEDVRIRRNNKRKSDESPSDRR